LYNFQSNKARGIGFWGNIAAICLAPPQAENGEDLVSFPLEKTYGNKN